MNWLEDACKTPSPSPPPLQEKQYEEHNLILTYFQKVMTIRTTKQKTCH